MNRPKHLLFVSLSAGAGHLRAAEALRKTAITLFPEATVEHIDMADYVTLPMKRAILDSYSLIARRLPELWGYLYEKINDSEVSKSFTAATKALKRMNSQALYQYLAQAQPDHIICTHYLPADIILAGRDRHGVAAPVSLVLTDYDMHALWVVPGVSQYFVASDKIRWQLAYRHHIPEDRIVVSGIPVDPSFLEKKDEKMLRRHYGIDARERVVLLLSGGYGLARIDEVAKELFRCEAKLRIIAVAGKNVDLEQSLRRLAPPPHITLDVLGWTDRMEEYMRVTDAVVTKPGGSTTTECIALGKPIIAIHPIPGQEEQNAAYILEHGFGVVARTTDDLLYYASLPPQTLTPAYRKAQEVQRSAERILRLIMA